MAVWYVTTNVLKKRKSVPPAAKRAKKSSLHGNDDDDGDQIIVDTKVQFLLNRAKALQESNRSTTNEPQKILIFSQFVSTKLALKQAFKTNSIQFTTIEGSMSMQQRSKNLNLFQTDPSYTVCILSIRTGAVGINLTAASEIYFVEPSFNLPLEQQAIGRCARIGQKSDKIKVHYLVMSNTVEDSIFQIIQSNARAGLTTRTNINISILDHLFNFN